MDYSKKDHEPDIKIGSSDDGLVVRNRISIPLHNAPSAVSIASHSSAMDDSASPDDDEVAGSGVPDEVTDPPYDPTKINIDTDKISLRSVIDRLENDEITIPDFQRGEVWDDQRKSMLIESLLVQIPLPAFYMDGTGVDGKWIVIDGLQRITALRDFIVEKSLKLKKLEFITRLNGCGYDDIDRHFQRRINEAQIIINIVQPGTPPELKFNVFKRINTGGVPLSGQEIRHALFQGKATELLGELAGSEKFVQMVGEKYDKRMRGRELILRFFAFVGEPSEAIKYQAWEIFLNEAIKRINDMDDADIDQLRQKFHKTLDWAWKIFGDAAGRKKTNPRTAINIALFESCMVTLGKLEESQLNRLYELKEKAKGELDELLSWDQDFITSVSTSTANIGAVRMRFSKYGNMVDGLVKD